MRIFLFKILFRLTWWVAPNKKMVDLMCDIYLELLEKEKQKEICEKRRIEMDACVRPKTYPKVKGCMRYTDSFEN